MKPDCIGGNGGNDFGSPGNGKVWGGASLRLSDRAHLLYFAFVLLMFSFVFVNLFDLFFLRGRGIGRCWFVLFFFYCRPFLSVVATIFIPFVFVLGSVAASAGSGEHGQRGGAGAVCARRVCGGRIGKWTLGTPWSEVRPPPVPLDGAVRGEGPSCGVRILVETAARGLCEHV